MSARRFSPAALAWVVAGSLALLACPGGEALGPAEDPPACDDDFRESENLLQLSVNRDVDVLFVIDNSGSMGEEQARLVAAAGELFAWLDEVDANYRIGFTTSDSGNPWCPAGQTTPEAGKLVLSPCFDRLGDFLFNNGAVDVQGLACTELCSADAAALEISPTATDVDPGPAPRPWLERIGGVTNFPSTTDPVEAFACFAPQGVNGCGFESQLESMYLALERARDSNEASYGFLRANAVLAVILVTDEADCSYNKTWSEIFDADGSKTFWSNPNSAFPSSAVCWNAGVSCTGDPSGYDSCEPVDLDLMGNPAALASDAVLQPLSRYRDLLGDLERSKQELNADQEVLVSVIAGVEGNAPDATLSYADAADPQFQLDFGIGPGCVHPSEGSAIPPVRLRALAETFVPYEGAPPSLHSVCGDSYAPALADIGERIAEQIRPSCYTQCVADTDLSTPQLEAGCTLEEDPPGNDNTRRLSPCPRDALGHYAIDPETGTYALPEGEDSCFVSLVDPDGTMTTDPNDDMSTACTDQHYNLEFEIVRREGVPAPGGTSISVSCELACFPDVTCAGIGG